MEFSSQLSSKERFVLSISEQLRVDGRGNPEKLLDHEDEKQYASEVNTLLSWLRKLRLHLQEPYATLQHTLIV